MIVVGNKADLDSERKLSKVEASTKVKQFNLPYFEVSAKTGDNVNEALMYLVREIREEQIRIEKVFFFFFEMLIFGPDFVFQTNFFFVIRRM